MVHTTPTKVLLTTTFQPLVVQLSGSLAHGVKLLDRFLHDELTPQKMVTFARDLRTLLREGGRRIMAWVLNRLEPEVSAEAPLFCALRDNSIVAVASTRTLWRRSVAP